METTQSTPRTDALRIAELERKNCTYERITAENEKELFRLSGLIDMAERRGDALEAALRLALGALEARGVSAKDAPENSQIAHWHALIRSGSATPAKRPDTVRKVLVGGRFDCPRCGTRHPMGPCINFRKAARKQEGGAAKKENG